MSIYVKFFLPKLYLVFKLNQFYFRDPYLNIKSIWKNI